MSRRNLGAELDAHIARCPRCGNGKLCAVGLQIAQQLEPGKPRPVFIPDPPARRWFNVFGRQGA